MSVHSCIKSAVVASGLLLMRDCRTETPFRTSLLYFTPSRMPQQDIASKQKLHCNVCAGQAFCILAVLCTAICTALETQSSPGSGVHLSPFQDTEMTAALAPEFTIIPF